MRGIDVNSLPYIPQNVTIKQPPSREAPMSITQAAQLVRAHGRGKDSQLMHVTPNELNALQGIARAKGGSLTINPNTGLPEAGFLEDVLPTVVGIGVGALTGGAAAPFIGAAVAGLGSYALTGSLEKGIMSGLGAFGGASALSSLGAVGAGAGAAGAAGTTAAGVAPTAATTTIGAEGLGSMAAMDVAMAGGNAAAQTAAQTAATQGIAGQMATQGLTGNVFAPTMYDALSTGDKMSAIGKGFGQMFSDPSGTMKMLPKGFVGNALMGVTPIVGGLMDSSPNGMEEPEQQNSYYRPSVYDPKTQRFTALPPVKTSDWGSQTFSGYAGSMGYAEGGEIEQRYERPVRTVDPAVTDYNRALMERAQQEYVQGMKFPVTPPAGIVAAAPVATNVAPGPGGMIYNPATQTFTPAAPTQSEIDKLREELMAMYGNQQSQGGDTNMYAGMAGGADGFASGGAVGIAQIPKFQAGGEMSSDAFVIPADVVSALGNGSTDAGVKILNNYLGVAMRIEGEGDGLSDDIPASIEGSQPARVADGEVYVPPDVVARLGEGDPEEGAEKLYEMIDSIRQSAHGKKSQQREVAPEKVMPV